MAEQQKLKKPGRFPLSGLLMALFLAFTLSSGAVGFLLGRNASRSTGELVDTIVLSPGDSIQRDQKVLHFLKGRLRYRSGAPCAGMTVRLGEESRTDLTDEQGSFYFSDVRSEKYLFSVTDEQGNAVGETELALDFSADAAVSAGEDGSFYMPEDTRMLELSLTVEEDQTITVEESGACFVTRDGQVVNFDGSALKVEASTRAVTPGGSLVDPMGYVLLPADEVVFTPQGRQIQVETGEETLSGAVVEEDGTVQMREGTVLLPSGEVVLPGGEAVGGGDKVVVVTEDGEAQELDQLPDVYTPPQAVSTVQAADEGTAGQTGQEPLPAGESPAVSEEVPEGPGEEAAPQEDPASEPAPAPTPEKELGLSVSDKDLVWQQESIINLFSSENRTDSMRLGEKNGNSVVAPGSQGYYDFCLKNPEEYDITYTITVSEPQNEGAVHLPIRYSVIDTANNESYLYRERIDSLESLSTPEILIPAGTEQNFRIDWEWVYEDWFRAEKDDAIDTAAAKSGKPYVVYICIEAGMSEYQPLPPWDGETRYPGVR